MRKGLATCAAAVLIAAAALPAGITTGATSVYACSKGEYTTPEYDYMAASNVFNGMVSQVEDIYYGGKPFRMATFIVDDNYKGGYVHSVLTSPDSDQCGITFELGHNYLVYANNRLGHPAASVFDVFEGEQASERIAPLKDLNMVPTPDPGEHVVTLYPGTGVAVKLNDSTIPATPAPLYYNNSLYVPTSYFQDQLGYVTVWNQEAQRYEILLRSEWAGIAAKGDPSRSEFIGNSVGVPTGTEPFSAIVTYSDVVAKVDGNIFYPELQPFKYDGVVYVPLRQTAERLGIQVNWDPATHTALMKDTRPILQSDLPVLVMKLTPANGQGPNLIVDRIVNDQAQYHVEQAVQPGQPVQQFTAPFSELIKETDHVADHSIRLFLKAGQRENELKLTYNLMNALVKDADMRGKMNFVLGRDFFSWPEYGLIGIANIQ